MSMVAQNWRARILSRKVPSRTAGKLKNPATCQATTLDKYFAKHSRSYKHPKYKEWVIKTLKLNNQQGYIDEQ